MKRAEIYAAVQGFRDRADPALFDQCVYFVAEENDGPIKIGVATQPHERLRGLQVGNPRPLYMQGWFIMPAESEIRLHNLLVRDWISGEWFKPTDRVRWAFEACVEFYGEKGAYPAPTNLVNANQARPLSTRAYSEAVW